MKELEILESERRNSFELLKESSGMPGSAEGKTKSGLPNLGESGPVDELGPKKEEVPASISSLLLKNQEEIQELESSVSTLKERLKERNNQKRDLLNELMEARKLIWEYKQE